MATEEQKQAIHDWMLEQFPAHRGCGIGENWDVSDYLVEAGQPAPNDLQHEAGVIFGVRDEDPPAPRKELGIAEQAFSAFTVDEILKVLDQLGVAEKLRNDPETRLFLDVQLQIRPLGNSSTGTS